MPTMAYFEGMRDTLGRQAQIKRLQEEDRKEKEALAEVKRKTEAARSLALTRGVPKELVNSMGLGELEGFNQAAREKELDAAKEEGRTVGERDNRAMSAAAMDWAQLPDSHKAYFARQTGLNDPTMAQQAWQTIGRGGRARAFGVSHAKTLEKADDYDRTMAQEAAQAAGAIQQDEAKFRREAPTRETEAANKKALTAEAQARTTKTQADVRNEDAERLQIQKASARDLERYRAKGHDVTRPVLFRDPESGVVLRHTPGKVDKFGNEEWETATPNFMQGNTGDTTQEAATGAAAATPTKLKRADLPPGTSTAKNAKGDRIALVNGEWVPVE